MTFISTAIKLLSTDHFRSWAHLSFNTPKDRRDNWWRSETRRHFFNKQAKHLNFVDFELQRGRKSSTSTGRFGGTTGLKIEHLNSSIWNLHQILTNPTPKLVRAELQPIDTPIKFQNLHWSGRNFNRTVHWQPTTVSTYLHTSLYSLITLHTQSVRARWRRVRKQ